MNPVYTVLVLAEYPYVFGVYSTDEKAEEVAKTVNKRCVIAVHDFVDSSIIGDILRTYEQMW